jgi:Arc/MetJ-type ribon-helix-helix transcriptional regulator
MVTISLKLSRQDHEQLRSMATKQRTTKSAIIRQAVRNLLKKDNPPVKESFLDSVRDLVGIVDGPKDLSTNPKYLMEALREDHHRHRPNRSHGQQE